MDCVFVLNRHLLFEVEVSGNPIIESLMRAFVIIEAEVFGQPQVELGDPVVGLEVEFFVFDRAPQAFDEHVVQCSAPSVHADANAFFLQPFCESGGSELRPLVGVEDLGCAAGEGFTQSLQTEIHLQGVGQPPGQHIPTIPIHHGDQIHKALSHRDIGNICAPDLVRPVDGQAP